MFKVLCGLFLGLALLAGCAKSEEADSELVPPPASMEQLSEINKDWQKEQQFLIEQFIERHGWEMQETGTGLRYMIYEHGNESDSLAKPGQIAWVQFEISPLGDTVVYRSPEDEAQSFLIEMDHVENGLHEMVTYMRVGDRAKVILPHHLAHGLLGDSQKIPPLTAVLYDLKLVDLENK